MNKNKPNIKIVVFLAPIDVLDRESVDFLILLFCVRKHAAEKLRFEIAMRSVMMSHVSQCILIIIIEMTKSKWQNNKTRTF